MEIRTETERDEGHVRKEAEPGAMRPQAKECVRLPEAGRVKEGSSLRGFQGRVVLLTP